MSTTTAALIRDRAITVIKALTPTSIPSDTFIASDNDYGADFRSWANGNPQAAVRRFQVRDAGIDDPVEVTNTDVETHYVTLEVIVSYPQTHRWGDGNALDRDRVMDEDRHAIEGAIGLRGAANFTPSYPDATYRGHTVAREIGAACDFLIISQKMSYLRSMT